MSRREIHDAAEAFLQLVTGPEDDTIDQEAALRRVLDRLAAAYHLAEPAHLDGVYPAPPRAEYKDLYARIARRFPSLGWYNVAIDITENLGTGTVGTGDAIDDLTDIALDLSEVVERWKQSENDAVFHFWILFLHWGTHLRELQLYLHDRAF